jgi:hypothetical protein
MRRLILAVILLPVLLHAAKAQESVFVGDWDVTLIKHKTKYNPPWLEIKYPVRMSFRIENGKLVGSYTDQYDFSDHFSLVVVQGNEIIFVHAGGGKKSEGGLMPVHRAILRDGALRGYVFTDRKQFEWIARKRKTPIP